LVHAGGWCVAFFIIGIVGSIWAAAWFFWFRDTPSEHESITPQEIVEIETARKQTKTNHKIDWKKIVRNPNIWILMLMGHLFFYASYFFTNWSSTYFQEGRHMSEEQAKIFVSFSYFLGAIGCIVGGFASDILSKKFGLKLGRRIVGVAGLGSSSICFLGAGLTTDNTMAGYLLALCVLLKDLTLPVAFAVCVDIGKKNSGTVTGAMNFAGQMGGIFINSIFGTIV